MSAVLEGVVMKSKLLGLMALFPFLGLSPANATTYNYNVNFTLGSATITGTIATDCDNNCALVGTDFGAWSFTLPGIGTITSSLGTGLFDTPTFLTASSTGISFNGTGNGGPVTFSRTGVGALNFEGGLITDYTLPGGTVIDSDDFDDNSNFQFATMAIGTTPLPAALPLFGTALGVGGVFGWRRKRKNAAATAAA
jgi:hypothetical protein